MALKGKKITDKKTTERKAHQMRVLRAIEFENGNIGFTLEIDSWITIYNMMLVALHQNEKDKEEITGYFIAFPQHKDDQGNWWNYAYFNIITPEQDMIEEQIEHLLDETEEKK